MSKDQAQSTLPLAAVMRPTVPMPPSFITSSPEIQEIVDQSSSEHELLTNLVSFAVDLISEDDFADFSTARNKTSRNNHSRRDTGDRQ